MMNIKANMCSCCQEVWNQTNLNEVSLGKHNLYLCPNCFEEFEKMIDSKGSAKNKIYELEKMFDVKHSEWFTVEREGKRYKCRFYKYGLAVKQENNNPYVHIDIGPYLLQDLIVGQAMIVDK